MTHSHHVWKRELGSMIRLAAPLVLAEIGWVAMSVVDTIMVGRLGAEAIGAVSLGGILFYAIIFLAAGTLLGLDPLVSQAFGAGRIRDCHRYLVNGVILSFPMAIVTMAAVGVWGPFLRWFGIQPAVLAEAVPYLSALNWSTLPLLFYFVFRRYLQGMSLVRPVMFALISANLVNVAANWALIFGNLGFPALGVSGAGWATCVARVYMAAVLLAYIFYYDWRMGGTGLHETSLKPDFHRMKRIVLLGFPAGLQISLEIGVFAMVTALLGRLDAISLAAHQIALNVASFTFMIPLGISSAAAVLVGQAIGRGDAPAASRAGWAGIGLGAGFMSLAAAALFLFPQTIARLFTSDVRLIAVAAAILVVAAFFQLFDGIQIVATGALRGLGNTRIAMISHIIAYWAVGLPLGYFLCFSYGMGAVGLWVGLSAALILLGFVLLTAWRHKVNAVALLPQAARAVGD